eukprot:m.157380 g.157380  ORF g.157380 m.157380 type:complete len:466 (-) comp31053_c0_seq2:208-1605(-)
MYDITVYATLVGLVALLAVLATNYKLLPKTAQNADFRAFQKKYLTVYYAVLLADWLQGPYLYRLYSHYGYEQSQIAALYTVGYVSAMISGPLLGGLADRHGRKKMCLTFCGLYSLSCLCKLFSNFFVLIMGRFLGGISTALLLSTFEAWMVFEHNRHGFPSDWLPRTFALSTFGNGIVAVFAGIVANFVADSNKGLHPVRPFILAVFVLAVSSWVMQITWEENKAPVDDDGLGLAPRDEWATGLRPILRHRRIWMLGLVQALFESAMYIFVFLWTPSLTEHHYHAPLGWIFASFMMAIVCGSTLFQLALSSGWKVPRILELSLLGAVGCFTVCFFIESPTLMYMAFVGFELVCGVYYPASGSLRGEILPEEHRAGIMGWFRVPLNILVVIMLFTARQLTHHVLFGLCAVLCFAGFLGQKKLSHLLEEEQNDKLEEAGVTVDRKPAVKEATGDNVTNMGENDTAVM